MKHAYLLIALLIISQMAISQTCNNSIIASTPDSHFSVNGQEVTDLETGLIWQKCPLGQTGDDCAGSAQQFNWAAALRAAETETQKTGKAWRLPNIKELLSIMEGKCSSPAINLTIFPNTNSISFWSASPDADYSNNVWYVGFGNGHSYTDAKGGINYVRLVRTGQ